MQIYGILLCLFINACYIRYNFIKNSIKDILTIFKTKTKGIPKTRIFKNPRKFFSPIYDPEIRPKRVQIVLISLKNRSRTSILGILPLSTLESSEFLDFFCKVSKMSDFVKIRKIQSFMFCLRRE